MHKTEPIAIKASVQATSLGLCSPALRFGQQVASLVFRNLAGTWHMKG